MRSKNVCMAVVMCVLASSVCAHEVASESSQASSVLKKEQKTASEPQTVTAKQAKQEPAQRYVVQLGAFKDEFQAVCWRKKLSDLNIKTFILPASEHDGVMRIRTGPFENKQEAQDMVKQLQQEGINQAIVLPEVSHP